MFSGICVKVTPNDTYKGDEKYIKDRLLLFFTHHARSYNVTQKEPFIR